MITDYDTDEDPRLKRYGELVLAIWDDAVGIIAELDTPIPAENFKAAVNAAALAGYASLGDPPFRYGRSEIVFPLVPVDLEYEVLGV